MRVGCSRLRRCSVFLYGRGMIVVASGMAAAIGMYAYEVLGYEAVLNRSNTYQVLGYEAVLNRPRYCSSQGICLKSY